jgi:uncharacterized protein YdeI (YjbR/CyaY-like superfamily)
MKPTFFATPAEFRAWFEENHQSAKELLVGFYERGSGKPSITFPESVDEALCFGWTDGVRKSIDEDAYTIRFAPRKSTSIWSAINVAKVAALELLGRMTPAGRRAFEARTPEREAGARAATKRGPPARMPRKAKATERQLEASARKAARRAGPSGAKPPPPGKKATAARKARGSSRPASARAKKRR